MKVYGSLALVKRCLNDEVFLASVALPSCSQSKKLTHRCNALPVQSRRNKLQKGLSRIFKSESRCAWIMIELMKKSLFITRGKNLSYQDLNKPDSDNALECHLFMVSKPNLSNLEKSELLHDIQRRCARVAPGLLVLWESESTLISIKLLTP